MANAETCSSLPDAALYLAEVAAASPLRTSSATFQPDGEESLLHIHHNNPRRFREIEKELARQLETILGSPSQLIGWSWKLGCALTDNDLAFNLEVYRRSV